MRRHLVILPLAGFLGVLLSAADAQACHKRKAACRCEPAPVVCTTVVMVPPPPPLPPPCPPPAPICAPKPAKKACGTCGDRHGLAGRMKCHKKAKAVCATPVMQRVAVVQMAPMQHGGQFPHFVAPAPQTFAAPQGGPIVAPTKAAPQG